MLTLDLTADFLTSSSRARYRLPSTFHLAGCDALLMGILENLSIDDLNSLEQRFWGYNKDYIFSRPDEQDERVVRYRKEKGDEDPLLFFYYETWDGFDVENTYRKYYRDLRVLVKLFYRCDEVGFNIKRVGEFVNTYKLYQAYPSTRDGRGSVFLSQLKRVSSLNDSTLERYQSGMNKLLKQWYYWAEYEKDERIKDLERANELLETRRSKRITEMKVKDLMESINKKMSSRIGYLECLYQKRGEDRIKKKASDRRIKEVERVIIENEKDMVLLKLDGYTEEERSHHMQLKQEKVYLRKLRRENAKLEAIIQKTSVLIKLESDIITKDIEDYKNAYYEISKTKTKLFKRHKLHYKETQPQLNPRIRDPPHHQAHA